MAQTRCQSGPIWALRTHDRPERIDDQRIALKRHRISWRQTLQTAVPGRVARVLTFIGVLTSRPLAFVIVGGYVVAWLLFSPKTLGWEGVATLATWIMTLFIQRAEHRDTQAIHAKLDELLRAEGNARNELTQLDDQQPEEIEAHREAEASKMA
jgi:low affinity Fe/Cu permease